MSEERKPDTAPALDEETLKRLAAEYQAGLDDIYESRKRRADALAAMTEEEAEAALAAELEEILADAEKRRMRIAGIPADTATAGSTEADDATGDV